jgi:hypothetical protein
MNRINNFGGTTMTKIGRGFLTAFGIFVLLSGATCVMAQTDPTKALVGTWEGWVEGMPNPERVLVIRSVKAKEGGGWTGDGRYGFTVEKMGRSPIDISLQGSDLMLEFTSGEKNPVKLKLVGENKLEGTANFVVVGRTTNRVIKLEKKATKAE